MSTLWDAFEATATRFGDRTAVEVQRRDTVDRFTYAQLRDLALERATWLAAHGLSSGDRCAILADNGATWCAGYLGVLSLGAVVVPLDTNYSANQVATITRDSGARILLANDRLMATAEAAVAHLDCVLAPLAPSFAKASEGEPPHPRTSAPSHPGTPHVAPRTSHLASSDAAVILYTSGTTSDPKGVVLTHANLLAERDAAFAVVNVTDRDSILGVLPLFHSLAQLANLLLPFIVGARVVYLETVNSQELIRALAERQITIFACVPQFFYLIHQRVMTEVGKGGLVTRALFRSLIAVSFRLRRVGINVGPVVFAKVHRTMGSQMRLFVTGGSKFDPAIGRDLYALGFTILQAYGLTETSAAASINTPHEAHIDTVGRALPGIDIRIQAAESADVDGEIAIRGPIVMRGYYNRPDKTAEVMRDGWFLTGDLGRMDDGGRITITGRKKEMIVLASGKNIYPEEVEAHYGQSSYIKEICVMGLATPEHPTTERLHAVVVPDMELMRERKIVNTGDILRFEIEGLAIGLPPHKRVLGYDISFDPLPRTTTGKVKRHEVERRLKEKRLAAAPESQAPMAAEDEAWLAEDSAAPAVEIIRRRVVGAARVTPHANLELDLGFDSMERVELLTELEQRFDVRVPRDVVHEIFTVRQLVDAVRATPTSSGLAASLAVQADESWAVLLRDLPPDSDPVLSGLLQRRPLLVAILFAASRLLRLCLGRVVVTGIDALPSRGPFIISPNHQSYLDPLVLCAVLPYRTFRGLFFVGAVEYFETPLTRWVARTVNCVPVDPDSNLVPAMQAGAFGLAHGKILILVPEGERSIDGTVRRFKKGAPILSRHLGAPIVPVALRGIHELWPRNRSFQWRLLLPWSGHHIRIAIGDPVRMGEAEPHGDAARRLQDIVAAMWEDI